MQNIKQSDRKSNSCIPESFSQKNKTFQQQTKQKNNHTVQKNKATSHKKTIIQKIKTIIQNSIEEQSNLTERKKILHTKTEQFRRTPSCLIEKHFNNRYRMVGECFILKPLLIIRHVLFILKGQCHEFFCHICYLMNRSHLGP